MTQPFELSIALDDRAVTDRLAALAASGADLTRPMGEISAYLLARIGLRFRSETAPDGVPWIKSQRVLGLTGKAFGPNRPSGQTLTDKGDLRGSMREDHGRDYAAAGPEASGGAAVYALAHQTGFKGSVTVPSFTRTVTQRFGQKLDEATTETVKSYARQMNLPAREYLGFADEDGVEVLDILGEHMAAALAGGAAPGGAA